MLSQHGAIDMEPGGYRFQISYGHGQGVMTLALQFVLIESSMEQILRSMNSI